MPQYYKQGSAPWEQNNIPTTYPQGEAPWEKSGAPPKAEPAEIIQEQHPDISFKDRFIAKNFANTPQDQINYLKQQHPDLDIKQINNQIVAKSANEKAYKVLDPDLSAMDMLKPKNWAENLKDIADIGTDVGIGSASTAAGTGAAVLAAPETALVGSIPAAMAAGGATGASLEALKQKIGQKLGVPQQMDPSQIALSGITNAAAPLLVGTGAAAKVGAQAVKQGASKEAAQELINNQKGLLNYGADYLKNNLLPSAAESVSGVPAQATKTLAKQSSAIQNLDENGVMDVATSAYDKLRNGLAANKAEVGAKLGKLVKDLGPEASIDLTKTKGLLDNQIQKLSQSELANAPAVQGQIQELLDARNQIFTELAPGAKSATEMSARVSPQKAFELQGKLSEMGNYPKTNSKGLVSTVSGTPVEKQWQSAARGAYDEINNELSNLTEGQSGNLKSQYKNYIDLQKNLNTYFKNPETTFKNLSSMESPSKKFASETLDKVKEATKGAIDITPEKDLLQAYKYYGNPSTTPISSKGATGTARSMVPKMIGAGIGYKIGGYPGAAIGGAFADKIVSPAAIKQYTLGASAAANTLDPYLNTQLGQAAQRGAVKWPIGYTWRNMINQNNNQNNGQ